VGIVHINMGNDAAALPLLMQSADMFKAINMESFYAITLVHLGNAALGLGKPEEARDWLDKAYPVAEKVGDPWIISFALNNLGEVSRVVGDYAKAREYYEASESLLRSMGDPGDLARLVHNLGYLAQHEGDLEKARMRFMESLSMFRKFGNKRGIAECLMGLASLQAAEGHPQRAAQLYSAAQNILSENGLAWWPADRGEVERTRATFVSALDDAELKAAQEKGRALTAESALALALEENPA
jgi:tetratricopeptide (TPR) repeat protein